MKKTKLLVLGIMPLLLSACGGQAESSRSSETSPTSRSEDPESSITSTEGEKTSQTEVTPSDSSLPPESSESSEPIESRQSSEASESSEPEGSDLIRKEVEVVTFNHFKKEDEESYQRKDKAIYDDRWFLNDSASLNPELALMSAMAGGASYCDPADNKGGKIKNLLLDTGFSDIALNGYYAREVKLEDSIGAIVGRKVLKDAKGEPFTLLAFFPRNAGYDLEWYGNFNMGKSGIHQGFKEARDELLRFLKDYISSRKIEGKIKLWASGYSRGAAVANLFGGYLADGSAYLGEKVRLTPSDLFVYTIGTPLTLPNTGVTLSDALSVSGPREAEGYIDTVEDPYVYEGEGTLDLSGSQYNGIHNFTATGDYITKLPYKEWDFSRYGKTEDIVYGEESMLTYLKEYDEETASKFSAEKNYSIALPGKTIDFQNFELVDTKKKISMDSLLEERLASLLKLGDSRADMVEKGYSDLFGAFTVLFGLDDSTLFDDLKSNIGAIVKAALFTYIDYASESKNIEPKAALSDIIMDLMELFGKEIDDRPTYTDQQFLSDFLDFLVNDYQTDPNSKGRYEKLISILPENIGLLYSSILDYAKEHEYQPRTVDGLFELLSKHVSENKDSEIVSPIIDALAGIFPLEYASYLGMLTGKTYNPSDYENETAMLRAGILDVLDCCANGRYDEGTLIAPDWQMRYLMYTAASLMALSGSPNLVNLIFNGSFDGEQTIAKDPAPLGDTLMEILNNASPKEEDGKTPLPFKDAVSQSIIDLLEKLRNERNGKYVDLLEAKPNQVKDIIINLLFNPEGEYSLTKDIENAATFINGVMFVYPAHFHEMYLAYLKAKVMN